MFARAREIARRSDCHNNLSKLEGQKKGKNYFTDFWHLVSRQFSTEKTGLAETRYNLNYLFTFTAIFSSYRRVSHARNIEQRGREKSPASLSLS